MLFTVHAIAVAMWLGRPHAVRLPSVRAADAAVIPTATRGRTKTILAAFFYGLPGAQANIMGPAVWPVAGVEGLVVVLPQWLGADGMEATRVLRPVIVWRRLSGLGGLRDGTRRAPTIRVGSGGRMTRCRAASSTWCRTFNVTRRAGTGRRSMSRAEPLVRQRFDIPEPAGHADSSDPHHGVDRAAKDLQHLH